MTIFQYIKKYGAFSFKQKPFNEVDNVILSFLAYLEFPDQLEDGITLQSFGTSLLEDDERVKKMKQDILSVRGSLKLLKAVYQQKRYRELQLFLSGTGNYRNIPVFCRYIPISRWCLLCCV